MGSLQYRLNPVHVGGKGGDDDPLIAVFKLPVHAFGHHLLGRSVAGAFHIGGVAQKGQYTLLSQHTQATQVHHAALCGGIVDVGAFVAELGHIGQHDKAVGKALRNVKLLLVFSR